MSSRTLLSSVTSLAIAAVALSGCYAGNFDDDLTLGNNGLPSGEDPAAEDDSDEGGSNAASTEDVILTGLEGAFSDASKEFDVPVEILKSLAFTESQWEMVVGEEEFEGMPAAYGVMGLRGDQVRLGAEIAQVTEVEAMHDLRSNIRAGAAVLANIADDMNFDRADVAAWAPALVAYSGIVDEEAQAAYIHREIYEVIRNGIIVEGAEGVVASLDAIDINPDFTEPPPIPQMAKGPDYDKAIYRKSPNQSARPSGKIGDPAMVIIHTCEGSYSGCWGWLKNSQAGVSAHYVVNDYGSEITQLVEESRKAWHIGASYKCSLNGGKDCWRDGYSNNNFTIGIEHAGKASQKSWNSGLINASAELVCDITKDHGIPRDKYHIIGHGQLQPYNRVDPGANWPWASYMSKISAYCNGQQPPQDDPPPPPQDDPPPPPDDIPQSTIIVDSNNNNNNGSVAKIEVSGNWNSSANVAGYHGTGYWWASTEAVSDGATFSFYLTADATRTIDAWWPAATDRSTAAPFVIFDAQGNKLGTVKVNQKGNGSQWVKLGTFNLKKGWNTVVLSRWVGDDDVVIADA
ncbi:MAG: N-acetylmuramoyl-L-alanine amidase, partial [Myxococcales bacterium]|nr:N-acetylmuramoyl-L-alanine amidase [Myxococcales bacterium]